MAITSFISSGELGRVAKLAYEGQDVVFVLANNTTNLDTESTLSDWIGSEVISYGFGYDRVRSAIAAGSYNPTSGRYELPPVDGAFAATNGGAILWDSVVLYISRVSVTASDIAFSGSSITTSAGDFSVFNPGEYVAVFSTTSPENNGVYEILTANSTTITVAETFTTASGVTATIDQSGEFPHSVLQEAPSRSLTDPQTQTYRINIITND